MSEKTSQFGFPAAVAVIAIVVGIVILAAKGLCVDTQWFKVACASDNESPNAQVSPAVTDSNEQTQPQAASVTGSQTAQITTSPTTLQLNRDQAVTIVEDWLEAKSDIFAQPFSEELVRQHTTGQLYEDLTKSDGPIAWLRNNDSYYVYRNSNVTDVWAFSSSGSRPTLKVRIFEDRTLYSRGRIDSNQSGPNTDNFIYTFSQEDGVWKIYDYQKDE